MKCWTSSPVVGQRNRTGRIAYPNTAGDRELMLLKKAPVDVRSGAKDRVAGRRKSITSPGLASMVPEFMAKKIVAPKKKRGPAPTGQGVQVGERWHPSELAAIDAWIASSNDKTITRAHAIRRLVALGLKVKK